MKETDENLEKLKYATERHIEIGKILQSFDPLLRPLEDMARHGITMSTGILGVSATIVGLFHSEKHQFTCSYLFLFAAWLAFLLSLVAGSVQLHRLSKFREAIGARCLLILGKKTSQQDLELDSSIMATPRKTALTWEFWSLGIGGVLFLSWAALQVIFQ